MWLRYRATRRKFKRLTDEIKSLRGKADALKAEKAKLERELKRTNNERYERELRLIDRILVSKDRFAITDEVRHAVESRDEETQEKRFAEDLKAYLQRKRGELYEDARDAGESVASADKLFEFNKDSYIEAFQSANKFE
jgi:hypothetical protein